MGKKTDKSTVGLILGFVKRMQEDHIGAYAAQAAYFLITYNEHNLSVGGQLSKTQGRTLHYSVLGEVWAISG